MKMMNVLMLLVNRLMLLATKAEYILIYFLVIGTNRLFFNILLIVRNLSYATIKAI